MRMPIKASLAALALAASFVTAAAVAGAQPPDDAFVPEPSFRDVAIPPEPSFQLGGTAAFPAPGYLSPDLAAFERAGAAEVVPHAIAPAAPTPRADPSRASGPAPTPPPTSVPRPPASAWHLDPNVSWYGPGFYGRRTACGEALTESLVGVANRTLPCGTLVLFRYDGRTVSAPVVDRGPYVSGRQWDLTAGLAMRLGHLFTGPLEWRLG